MKRTYNYKFQPKDERDYIYKKSNIDIPMKYNITENMNSSIIKSPILDQGQLGSCVAHAAASLFYILSHGKINLSRLQLYFCCRGIDGSKFDEDTGTYVRTALKSVALYGLTNECFWKYDTNNFSKLPPRKSFRPVYTIKNYTYTSVPQNLESLKNCLSAGNPIIFGSLLYSSSNNTNSTGVIPIPDIKNETLLGGHCMLLIGFDDSLKQFKIQNSWGPNWGDSGYGYLDYNYILNKDLTSDLWTVHFTI